MCPGRTAPVHAAAPRSCTCKPVSPWPAAARRLACMHTRTRPRPANDQRRCPGRERRTPDPGALCVLLGSGLLRPVFLLSVETLARNVHGVQDLVCQASVDGSHHGGEKTSTEAHDVKAQLPQGVALSAPSLHAHAAAAPTRTHACRPRALSLRAVLPGSACGVAGARDAQSLRGARRAGCWALGTGDCD